MEGIMLKPPKNRERDSVLRQQLRILTQRQRLQGGTAAMYHRQFCLVGLVYDSHGAAGAPEKYRLHCAEGRAVADQAPRTIVLLR